MQPSNAVVAALPKIHLHCHLEGALRAETFVELTDRYGISTRYRPGEEVDGPRDPAQVYHFSDFREFLLTFAAVSRSLARPDDYARLAREFVDDARNQNVVYGELFVSPSVWTFFNPQLDIRDAFAAISEELRHAREFGAEFRLIVDVTRNFGADSAMRTARLAASLTDRGVIGIGLGGDEARFPASMFRDVFAFARSEGLHAVAHAGEAAGADSVRDAVTILGAERIGHGIRALEDDAIVDLLRQKHIPLEVCPTSNFLTGVADRDLAHPIAALDDAGVVVTVDADDPTLFGTSIAAEYAYVAELLGVDRLVRFVHQAIDAAFLDREQRDRLHELVRTELSSAR